MAQYLKYSESSMRRERKQALVVGIVSGIVGHWALVGVVYTIYRAYFG